ncbi:type II secretion system protein GspJ [Exilibacterium tricleocarpae]|uniref:Type II secretion system protein J n=1 Tax=Exilibacterium tricleocarpae TaxID=2591008 RepID=A0A545TZ62_9GAMM|nr:type II secretion system minor pseudopilin GspJ [Exilibacterium tricleocarpae]TQV82510.1 type II secretion system protein GspJ [Exilibacterium tricleocarpae]
MNRRPGSGRQRGFTLLEVLVAMAISVLVAALAYEAFDVATEATERTSAAAKRLNHIDRALQLIETDLRHALARSGKDALGLDTAAFSGGERTQYLMLFVRGGWTNPLNQPRSELQRVGYRFDGETLWRDYWFVVDGTGVEEPQELDLLEEVKEVTVRFLPDTVTSLGSGQWQTLWPPVQGAEAKQLPAAVEMTIELEDLGEITRLFDLAVGA